MVEPWLGFKPSPAGDPGGAAWVMRRLAHASGLPEPGKLNGQTSSSQQVRRALPGDTHQVDRCAVGLLRAL